MNDPLLSSLLHTMQPCSPSAGGLCIGGWGMASHCCRHQVLFCSVVVGLPNWTAVPALYLLYGQLPVEHQLDIKNITVVRSLLTIQCTREILLRQCIMKNSSSQSLVVKYKELLRKYNLSIIVTLDENTPHKEYGGR